MAEQTGEKTELPSHKKVKDAQAKGNISKSKDVTNTAVLFGVSLYLLLGMGLIYSDLRYLFDLLYQAIPDPSIRLKPFVISVCLVGAKIICTVLGLALSLALLASFVQTGFNVSPHPVKPTLDRVNPVSGLKKLFRLRNVFEIGKSAIALGLIGAAIYLIVDASWEDLAKIPLTGIWAVLDVSIDMVVKLMAFVLPLFVLKSVSDLIFQRFVWYKDLRMTKDEVKRERREQDGDPLAKSERKKVGVEMLESDNLEMFDHASLILRDSSGAAIGIYYNPSYAALPIMLFKVRGSAANDILGNAQVRGIRIVHDDALTRLLFRRCRANDFIPEEAATDVGWLLRRDGV